MTDSTDDELLSPSIAASTANAEGDLFTPSLDASYDATDIEPPWQPRSLLWPSFIGGPITGTILYWRNAGFIGRKSDRKLIVSLFLLLMLAACLAQIEGLRRTKLELLANPLRYRDWVHYATRGATLLIAFWLGSRQEQRFRIYRGDPRPLLLPGLGAILGGWALSVPFFLAVAVVYAFVCELLGIEVPQLI